MSNEQYILYKIENKINNKIYIGQTIAGLKIRWSQHKTVAKSKNQPNNKLYNAFRLIGVENFYINSLCEVSNIDELNEIEEFIISETDSINMGYNSAYGGLNNKQTYETRKKISNYSKNKKLSDDHKRSLLESRKGAKATDETKQKMKKAWIKRKEKGISEETRKKLSDAGYKRKMTEEDKLKISRANKGKKRTIEQRNNISVGRKNLFLERLNNG
jgi:group I intron endonuclease